MPIYTKTGDQGETSLFGGRRISKADIQVDAYGTVDELTSSIGVAIAKEKSKKVKIFLSDIQKDLYSIMAYLAGAKVDIEYLSQSVKQFEQYIDLVQSKLPKLNSFILPQGGEISAWYHVVRTTSRRCERVLVAYSKTLKQVSDDEKNILVYFNRLSDLFFIMARQKAEKEIKIKTF